jgi:hypothetical protein
MLLSLVLLRERRPRWAGVVAGLAAVMKLTAWPLLPFLAIAARDRAGHRASVPCLAAIAAVVVPVVVPFALWNPRAFVEDVVLFPLGIAEHPTLAAPPSAGRSSSSSRSCSRPQAASATSCTRSDCSHGLA